MSKFLDYEGLKTLKEKDDETYLKEIELTDISELPQSHGASDSDLLIKGLSLTGELYSITLADFLKSIAPELLGTTDISELGDGTVTGATSAVAKSVDDLQTIISNSKQISTIETSYQVSDNGSTAPTGTWSSEPVATSDGQYLWTRIILNFTDGEGQTVYLISKAGETGAKGDAGEKGDKGDTGDAGSAATISVGTVTTGDAGSNASVTNSGTTSAAVFDFTIPRGDKGDVGDAGENGKDCAWNILRGTNSCTELVNNSITDMWDRAEWGASTVNGTMEGRESIEINDPPVPDIKLGWRFSNVTSLSSNFNIVQRGIPYIDGEIYTLSTYARGHGTLRLGLGSTNWTSNCDIDVDSEEWTRISVTGFDTTGQARVLFTLLGDGAEHEVEICGMKLEAGEYTTEWAPSTYDLMCTAITEEQIDLMFLPRVDDETLYYYDDEATASGTTVTVTIDSAYSYVQSTTYYVAETIDILLEM